MAQEAYLDNLGALPSNAFRISFRKFVLNIFARAEHFIRVLSIYMRADHVLRVLGIYTRADHSFIRELAEHLYAS